MRQRTEKTCRGFATKWARSLKRLSPAVLLPVTLCCTRSTPDDAQARHIEQVQRQLSDDLLEAERRIARLDAGIDQLEAELELLKAAADLVPATMPSTFPSDSTTLPARLPAP